MNYAWKYDSLNRPGTFYDRFRYSFSDEELVILRHQPDRVRPKAVAPFRNDRNIY